MPGLQDCVQLLRRGGGLDEHLCAGADSILADRRIIITAITLIIIMPLCFPRELGALAWVSIAAVRAPSHAFVIDFWYPRTRGQSVCHACM